MKKEKLGSEQAFPMEQYDPFSGGVYEIHHGKDERYLKAMPIAWENIRKLIQK